MKSLLIPTGFDPGSYSCVRSLSRQGVNTIIASEHDDVPAGASRFCDERLSIPAPEEGLRAYKDALLDIAARRDVRTIVPIRPYDPYVFARWAGEFESYVSLVTPTMEQLETVHDRLSLVSSAEAAGVPVPDTQLLSAVDDWSGEQIVKSRYNLITSAICDDLDPDETVVEKRLEQLPDAEAADVDSLCEEMNHEPIVQEYVHTSDEYVFGALYDSGEALATFQHRQIRGDSYTHGGGVYRESVHIPELEDVGRTLLDHLDWHGLACIEYMRDADTGEFVLTEINPRLWQSLACAVRAGADFPYNYWLAAMGDADRIDPNYEDGVGSHLLYGELGHLLSIIYDESPIVEKPSVARTAAEIGSSCYRMPNFDCFRLDDPVPLVKGVQHLVGKKV